MLSKASTVKLCAALLLCGALAACKSPEEQAEEYYRSALELIEAGDTNRAIVELRNAFDFDATHRKARTAMARIMYDQGNLQGAYSNYLTLAEQFPDDLEARIVLAEIAFGVRNWQEFERHGSVAVDLDPDAPRVGAIAFARDYRAAVIAEDSATRAALVPQAEALAEALPDNLLLSELLVDAYTRDNRFEAALGQIDAMIAHNPNDRNLYDRRIAYLARMGDMTALERELRVLIDRFPDTLDAKSQLVQFYISRDRLDDAEAFLREIADPAADDPGLFIDLIRFVTEVRGPEAARAEIERAIAVNPRPARFIAMRASLDFSQGDQAGAITALEELLSGLEPSPASRDIRVTLARMLVTEGNEVGARAQVETVLTANPNHVEALKMQSVWQIQSDDVDGAIASLRLALDAAPDDVQAINLMAEAYGRAGSPDLVRDFLALAVDASNNAPAPSLRYAELLMNEERYQAAEDVLLPALRLAPRDVTLLSAVGRLYIPMEDLGRARQVIDTLRRIGTPEATVAANGLEAGVLEASQGTEQAIAFMEQLASGADAELNDQLMLLRARLTLGERQEALALADRLLEENPGNEVLQFALGVARAVAGDLEGAKGEFQTLVAADAARPRVWMELSRVHALAGDRPAAAAAIDSGLDASPGEPGLLWAKASLLEEDADIEGAIAIYEELYARDSSALVIANNLASLLSTYRTDDASLDRAWTIARRLRDTEIPALQDTYGWIAFRRGQVEEAIPYLEGAAAGLPEDPLVQVHLGLALAAAGRDEEALTQLQTAVVLAGPADTRDQLERARAEISRLRAAQQQQD